MVIQSVCKQVAHIFSGMRDGEALRLPYDCLEVFHYHGKKHYRLMGQTTKLTDEITKTTRWVTCSGLITNDQVSLEAGRGRGSIKKSRPVFAELISAIEKASKAKNTHPAETQEKYLRKRAEAENYKA